MPRPYKKSPEISGDFLFHSPVLETLLTGHNYANRSQQVSTISSGTVEQHITRYCKSQPRGDFSDAAFRLSDQFSGRNAAITK